MEASILLSSRIRSRFFSKLAVSFLRPPIPRSRIEFIFLVLVKVPFGHLTLCRTLIPTKSIQTFNQVFRRNYHLECKKKKKLQLKKFFTCFGICCYDYQFGCYSTDITRNGNSAERFHRLDCTVDYT